VQDEGRQKVSTNNPSFGLQEVKLTLTIILVRTAHAQDVGRRNVYQEGRRFNMTSYHLPSTVHAQVGKGVDKQSIIRSARG
jgi:hypothetical protein